MGSSGNRHGLWRWLIAAAAVGTLGLASDASAQSDDSRFRGYRSSSDLGTDALMKFNPRRVEDGIRAGGFLILPSIDVGIGYDDNIFSTSRAKTDDFVLRVAPDVRAQSRWSRHMLDLHVGGTSIIMPTTAKSSAANSMPALSTSSMS